MTITSQQPRKERGGSERRGEGKRENEAGIPESQTKNKPLTTYHCPLDTSYGLDHLMVCGLGTKALTNGLLGDFQIQIIESLVIHRLHRSTLGAAPLQHWHNLLCTPKFSSLFYLLMRNPRLTQFYLPHLQKNKLSAKTKHGFFFSKRNALHM